MLRVTAKDCNFIRARLSNADMREGDFENSNFSEAHLENVNLDRACLQFCTLTDANLERATITNLRGGNPIANANIGVGAPGSGGFNDN